MNKIYLQKKHVLSAKILQAISGLALGLGLLIPSLNAELISYDGFDYNVGNLPGSDGGTGWTTQWNGNTSGDQAQVVAHSLRYSNGDIIVNNDASGKALHTRNNTIANHAYRRIAIAPAADEIYISILFQANTPDDSWFTQLWLWDTVIGGTETYPSMSQFGNGTLNARIGGSGVAASGADTRNGNVHFLVIRLSKTGAHGSNFDRVDLYVDPDSLSWPAVSDVSRVINTGKSYLDFIGFRTNSAGGSTNADLYWGELRVSETWSGAVEP